MTTSVLYTGDGSTRSFAVPFPYIAQAHVKVRVNGVPLVPGVEFVFSSAGAVDLRSAPVDGAAVEVSRETPVDGPLVQFQNGAVLNERDLNLAVLQTLYLLQETRDALDSTVGEGVRKVAGGAGVVGTSSEEIIANITDAVLRSALLANLQSRLSDLDLVSEASMQNAANLASEINRVDGLFPRLNGIDASILSEQSARVSGDTALATRVDGLQAVAAGMTAQLATEQSTRASADLALAQSIQTLQSFSARIYIQATAPTIGVAPDNAGSGDIWYDSSDGNHPYRLQGDPLAWQSIRDGQFAVLQAQVQSEQQARIDADSALASSIYSLAATLNTDNSTLSARITSEESARASADGVLASQITTVQSAVGSNTATIQQQAKSIDGLSAQYTVKVDVNGYVSGFGLASTAKDGVPTSEFIVLANRFAIVTPGATPVVPFAVDAQGVYMNTAYIRTLVVDKIAGGAVNAQWGFYNGGGRIVLDTGTYMKVIGVGFGANNDLLEWFGPKMEVWQCTKANATTYVGTNGDAYFGGALRAGTLYNARQSSDVGTNVSLPLGPFGSNGGNITVTLSYAFVNSWYTTTNDGTGSEPMSATVDLYQAVGAGGETKVATLVATGTRDRAWDSEVHKTNYTVRVSGSLTFTDTLHTAASRTYRAYLASRSYGYNGSSVAQTISLTSTEQ